MAWIKKSEDGLAPLKPSDKFNDPYEKYLENQFVTKNLLEFDNSSKFQKKLNKLKQRMYIAKHMAIQGAMMGFMVGGLFGFMVGVYSAFQTRRLLTIPLSMLGSGCFFGFIFGCGSMIRTAQTSKNYMYEG